MCSSTFVTGFVAVSFCGIAAMFAPAGGRAMSSIAAAVTSIEGVCHLQLRFSLFACPPTTFPKILKTDRSATFWSA